MKQILLLEDDEGLNRGISLKLKKEGYEVFSAFTIKEARQFLEQESIDLLISDISLPDGSGMEFCKEARAKSELYIIFLSALDQEELQLLIYLMENAGRIVTKEQILEHVWDMEGQFVEENTVTVNISRLKNKLQTNAIGNVRGLGYLWTEKVRKE